MAGLIDLTHCPVCGSTDNFAIHTDERMYGSNPLTITIADDGTVKAEWGVTKVYFDTSTTVGYFTDCCGESLPDDWQDELDRLLNIQRETDKT